jgi:hypothetical protein
VDELTSTERLKFRLLGEGMRVTEAARGRLMEATSGRPATPADYASTSGLILSMADDVWVNAPVPDHNPAMVSPDACTLDVRDGSFLLVTGGHEPEPVSVWVPPEYHHDVNAAHEPFTAYAHTHGDRVRIAPIEGCSMRCRFCDLPYEFAYRKKDPQAFVEAVDRALRDPVQPAAHVLISGGTPNQRDVDYVREVYTRVLEAFPTTPIDIMMVPVKDLLDPTWLATSGVHEISVNIELIGDEIASKLMPQKHRVGLNSYLDYMENAASVLGPSRVRSMLMVGLEPLEATLEGVRLIAERGCVPVLSPFRADPITPLASARPPSWEELVECYLRARDITAKYDVSLGPSCAPCTHNTLTLSTAGHGDAYHCFGKPVTI